MCWSYVCVCWYVCHPSYTYNLIIYSPTNQHAHLEEVRDVFHLFVRVLGPFDAINTPRRDRVGQAAEQATVLEGGDEGGGG